MGGHVAHQGGIRNVYKILVGKSEGKRLDGRLRHRWKGNFKIQNWNVSVWTEFVRLRTGTSGGLSGICYRSSGIYKIWGVS
jgi:hypothetical protein